MKMLTIVDYNEIQKDAYFSSSSFFWYLLLLILAPFVLNYHNGEWVVYDNNSGDRNGRL